MVTDTVLKTVRYTRQKHTQHEEQAIAAIRAGMVAERTVDGIQPHSGGAAQPIMFCKERRSAGMEFGDTFPVGEVAMVVTLSAGSGVHALLEPGETVQHGDRVVSTGTGTVRLIDQDGTAPDDENLATVGVVDLGEQATNFANGQTVVDNSAGTEPVAVPIETV